MFASSAFAVELSGRQIVLDSHTFMMGVGQTCQTPVHEKRSHGRCNSAWNCRFRFRQFHELWQSVPNMEYRESLVPVASFTG
jgi:hypothetical protein